MPPRQSHTHDQPVRPRAAVMLSVGLPVRDGIPGRPHARCTTRRCCPRRNDSRQIPNTVRLVTGFQTVLWLFAALLVLARGGYASIPLPKAVPVAGAWVLVALLGLGVLMNFASSSPWERFGWGPFTLVLFALGVALARSGLPARPRGRTTMT